MRKKIGLLGGTFNPVHLGHLMMAQCALEQAALDKVYLLPSKAQNYKSMDELASAEDRLNMLRLSVEGAENISVSDFELAQKDDYTFTYQTLSRLCDKYPDTDYYFIIGADSLMFFENWVHPEILSKKAEILAFSRKGSFSPYTTMKACSGIDLTDIENDEEASLSSKIEELKERFGTKVSLLDMPYMELSSTVIRQRAKMGLSLDFYVPKAVADYIRDNKLYK